MNLSHYPALARRTGSHHGKPGAAAQRAPC